MAGYVTGASWGVLYICRVSGSHRHRRKRARKIIRRRSGGRNILGTKFSFDFKVIHAQGAYICGEETALLSSIEGQRPEVRYVPSLPSKDSSTNPRWSITWRHWLHCPGYWVTADKPMRNSVQKDPKARTRFAGWIISIIARYVWSGNGTPLRKVIDELGQGFRHEVKAMHIGGPLGGLVPVSKIDDLTVDFESFSKNGFLLGHASVVCIPQDFPLVKYIEHLFEFTAHESCGKCFLQIGFRSRSRDAGQGTTRWLYR